MKKLLAVTTIMVLVVTGFCLPVAVSAHGTIDQSSYVTCVSYGYGGLSIGYGSYFYGQTFIPAASQLAGVEVWLEAWNPWVGPANVLSVHEDTWDGSVIAQCRRIPLPPTIHCMTTL